MKLDYINQKSSQNPDKAIIFIHGWSGNKISFLPLIKRNHTFATIEEINLSITADVFSKLTGIKIGVEKSSPKDN